MKTNTHYTALPQVARLDGMSMRARNRAMLLRRIFASRTTNRAELARATGMSRSATSALVESLLGSGLVAEAGPGVSRGGRRPTRLSFVDDAYSILGIDLGATHATVVLTNLRGRIDAMRSAPCPMRDDPAAALALVPKLAAEALAEAGVLTDRILGAGLAVANPINPDDPGRLPPLFLPAWRDVDLLSDLVLPGDPPLIIGNDANLGALAESWWGAGRDGSDLAFIKLGTGIGAGFILDGEIFRGQGGTAGEIGHLVIDPNGPTCVCGLRGCLATFIGTPALLDAAEALRADYPDTLMVQPGLDSFINAGRQGDALARRVIETASQRLGLAVAGLLNLFNPKTVVLGGALATLGDALLTPLRTFVSQRSVWSAVANTRIVASELGEYDVALGAATRVLQQALTQPTHFPIEWSN